MLPPKRFNNFSGCLRPRVMGHDELWRRLSGYSSSASQASEEPAADLRWLSGQDVAGAIIVRSNRSAARQQQMRVRPVMYCFYQGHARDARNSSDIS